MWTLLAVANAAVLDVCPAGCTSQTVQGAVDLAAPGDVIEIAAGFYPEAVEVTSALTLRGDGAGRTILDGGELAAVIDARGHGALVLEGLTLRNSDSGPGGAGVRSEDGDLTLRGCWIQGVGAGVLALGAGRLVLQNNVITDTLWAGVDSRVAEVQLRNNTIVGAGTWGLVSAGGSALTLNNNNFIDIGLSAVEVRDTDTLTATWNNTFETGQYPGWPLAGSAWTTFNGVGRVPRAVAPNNLSLPPDFTDPNCGDFNLQSLSPLVDAGDPALLDADGSRSDVGVGGGPLGVPDFGDDGDGVCGVLSTPGLLAPTGPTPYIVAIGNDSPTPRNLSVALRYRAGGERVEGPYPVSLGPFSDVLRARRLSPIPTTIDRLLLCVDVRDAGRPRAYNCDVIAR